MPTKVRCKYCQAEHMYPKKIPHGTLMDLSLLPKNGGGCLEHLWKQVKGFANMKDQTRRLQICSKGGKKAHANGTAHHFTKEEARIAGKKGGKIAHMLGVAHEFTREEAAVAGKKGGLTARKRKEEQTNETGRGQSQGI